MPRRRLPALAVVLVVTVALGMAACDGGSEGRTERSASGRDTERHGAPRTSGQDRARGVMTVTQADRLLDRYEQLVNKANRTRDPALLAKAEAGNALERSRAGYEQHKTLSRRERAERIRPFSYRHRAFHIPSGTNWFLATATRVARNEGGARGTHGAGEGRAPYDTAEPSGKLRQPRESRRHSQRHQKHQKHQRHQNHQAPQPRDPRKSDASREPDAFHKSEASHAKSYARSHGKSHAEPSSAAPTAASRPSSVLLFAKRNGHWRLRAALELQTGRLPRIARNDGGLATAVPATAKIGKLSADDIPAAYEDLWQTGGKKEAAALARNPVTREARSTYRNRDEALGAQGAHKRFVPRAPRYDDSYALRTADGGVLALVPLAHEQRLRVTRPGLQITPSAEEAVYDAAPRTAILTTFHGQALAQLPRHGLPRVLAAKYALVGSR